MFLFPFIYLIQERIIRIVRFKGNLVTVEILQNVIKILILNLHHDTHTQKKTYFLNISYARLKNKVVD